MLKQRKIKLAENLSHTVTKMEKKKKALEKEILIENVTIKSDGKDLVVKGPKGEIRRKIFDPSVKVEVMPDKVLLSPNKKGTKRESKIIRTFVAHIKNMIKGVTEGHIYKLKICSGHFPMNVSISNNEFIVKNFIGEKVPRKIPVKKGADVKIDGFSINVTGIEKEIVSQMAASIEELTKRPGFDTRIFQDGIYIIEKDGKEIKS
jgi:large subunit ribosomal protein L6